MMIANRFPTSVAWLLCLCLVIFSMSSNQESCHAFSVGPVSSTSRQFTSTTQNMHLKVQQQSNPNTKPTTRLFMGQQQQDSNKNTGNSFMDGVGKFFKRFTTKATASHILIKGGAEAANKLEDLKAEIDNSPLKFAQYAAKYSQCPSASNGGNLGEFGPGAMVPEFDTVVFSEPVGQVHGPIKTQFGYHLIYISNRTE